MAYRDDSTGDIIRELQRITELLRLIKEEQRIHYTLLEKIARSLFASTIYIVFWLFLIWLVIILN